MHLYATVLLQTEQRAFFPHSCVVIEPVRFAESTGRPEARNRPRSCQHSAKPGYGNPPCLHRLWQHGRGWLPPWRRRIVFHSGLEVTLRYAYSSKFLLFQSLLFRIDMLTSSRQSTLTQTIACAAPPPRRRKMTVWKRSRYVVIGTRMHRTYCSNISQRECSRRECCATTTGRHLISFVKRSRGRRNNQW